MPEFDRIERGVNMEHVDLPPEVEASLNQLISRLDNLSNDDLSARQAEKYYEGAKHIKNNPDQYPQYQQYSEFIEKIISTYEDSLPSVEEEA